MFGFGKKKKPSSSKRKKIWVTAEGDVIQVSEMNDTHLHNAVKYLIRRAQGERAGLINLYSTVSGPNGDMAVYCFESSQRTVLESEWVDFASPKLVWLLEEANKRLLPWMDDKMENILEALRDHEEMHR